MLSMVAVLALMMQEDVHPPQAEIERAIKSGTDALIRRRFEGPDIVPFNTDMGFDYDALLLYTLVHSGLSLQHELVQSLIGKVEGAPLTRTYQVAMTATALAAIDPMKYQAKIAQCAQYLVDYQCDNGQWGYGDRYDPPSIASAPGQGANRTVAKVVVKRVKKLGGASGDNSNSQYAVIGLRACSTAACEIEPAALSRSLDWWEKSQMKDGGWSYHHEGVYNPKFGIYGSMTAGAVSSLIMLKQMKNSDPKLSSSITRGMAWMAANFSVEKNPATTIREEWHFYYLYALERVGDLFPTEKIGKRSWYAAGATWLLKNQKADGTWAGTVPALSTADTCFALLFLERVARRPPVATGGKAK